MRAFSSSMTIDADTAARVSEDFWRKWQETVSDATATWAEASQARGPANLWSAQLEFSMRNAQRWCGWMPAAPAPAETAAAPEAPADEVIAPEVQEVVPQEVEAPEVETLEVEPSVVAVEEPIAEAEPEQVTVAAEFVLEAEAVVESEPVAAVAEADEAEADDLKRIRGIGPAIERKLNAQGISTYRQIAGMSDADVEALDALLDFRGRIDRDGWVKQAEQLALRSEML